MARNLALRSRTAMAIRNELASQGFLEVETPILTKSTPEGARDYLVPSRLNHGQFYALPQSPQQFKQFCMIAGLILVPVISLLTPAPDKKLVDDAFSCYDEKVLVRQTQALGDRL